MIISSSLSYDKTYDCSRIEKNEDFSVKYYFKIRGGRKVYIV